MLLAAASRRRWSGASRQARVCEGHPAGRSQHHAGIRPGTLTAEAASDRRENRPSILHFESPQARFGQARSDGMPEAGLGVAAFSQM